jgi:hypothetical protein
MNRWDPKGCKQTQVEIKKKSRLVAQQVLVDAETGFYGKDVKSFTRVDRKCVHVMMCEIPPDSMPRRIHPCIVALLEPIRMARAETLLLIMCTR